MVLAAPDAGEEARPRRGGPRAGKLHPEFKVDVRGDGRQLPYIKHYTDDKGTNQLGAHCRHPDHGSECRVNRTVKEGASKPAQGRPLGFLLAWLKCANDFTGADGKERHMQIARSPYCLFDDRLTFIKRSEMRAWASDNGSREVEDLCQLCAEIERPPRIGNGEGTEPEGHV